MMLINNEAQYVWLDLGASSFAHMPRQRMDLWQERIRTMPTNDENAWKMHSPTAYLASESFGHQNGMFANKEGFAAKESYSGEDYSNSATVHGDIADFKVDHSRSSRGPRFQMAQEYGRQLQACQASSNPTDNSTDTNPMSMNFLLDMQFNRGTESPGSTLGMHNDGYSNTPSVFLPGGVVSSEYVAVSGPAQTYSSPMEESSWTTGNSFGSTGTNSNPAHIQYLPVNSSANQAPLGLDGLHIHSNDDSSESTMPWSSETGHPNQAFQNLIYGNEYTIQKPHSHCQGSYTPAINIPFKAMKWPSQLVTEGTVSPAALRMNTACVSSSSPDPSHRLAAGWSECPYDGLPSPSPDPLVTRQESLPEQELKHQLPRRLLPSSVSASQRASSASASDHQILAHSTAKKARRSGHRHQRQASPAPVHGTKTRRMAHKTKSTSQSSSVSYNVEPSHMSGGTPQSWSDSDSPGARAEAEQKSKDAFLIQCKKAGMRYKEIKESGNFPEAESTLRGRYRTLTKDKSARVRKPEWTTNDDHLLGKAVRKLTPRGDQSKTPWKQVSEYILDNGGSYKFGNATCRKRWDDISGKH